MLEDLTAEEKMKNLSALNYIKTIANSSNIDISAWDILEVFGREDKRGLELDKKTLNKLFFAKVQSSLNPPTTEETKTETKTEGVIAENAVASTEDLTALKNAVAIAYERTKTTAIEAQKKNTKSAKDNMDQYYRNFLEYERNYISGLRQVKLLESTIKDGSEKYIEGIILNLRKVIDKGIWINPVFDENYLYLNTKTNVVLHDVNKSANLDLHLDVGQLAVRINLKNNFALSVIPYKGNIQSGAMFHPHVNSEGTPCWGDAQNIAVKAIADYDFEKALTLLHTLLHTYNPGSPYINLANLKENGIKMSRVAEHLKHPDKNKKKKEEAAVTPTPAPTPAPDAPF
jgi:hypothetical protein